MKAPLEVSYDVLLVAALVEANKIMARLEMESEVVFCRPAWQKLYNVREYIKNRQKEVLKDTLADPEKEAVNA